MLVYADAHTHTNPVRGMGMKIVAEKFRAKNGWFMAIVGLAPWSYGLTPNVEGYTKSFELVLRECDIARQKGLKVACILGVHPADIDKLVYKYGLKLEDALNLVYKVIDIVIDMCKQGRIDGIGEIGRPHYRIDPVFVAAAELVMLRVMEAVKDYECVLHLHLEQGGVITVESIEKLAKLVRLRMDKVIFHHSRPGLLDYVLTRGYNATIPGIEAVLRIVFSKHKPAYMVESDHIDDPHRPGVVVYPWQLIENQNKLLKEGLIDEEYLYKVNVDNVVRTYGIEPP